jgi:beta-glucosidase
MIDNETEITINELIKTMTLEEKVSMCHGAGLFRNSGVERLGIPPLKMSDGPCGVRREFHDGDWGEVGLTYDRVSYLPANTALAAT